MKYVARSDEDEDDLTLLNLLFAAFASLACACRLNESSIALDKTIIR